MMFMQELIPIGIALIFIGIILIIAGSVSSNKGKVEWGVGGFIGPIPFGFTNSKNMLYFIAFFSLIVLVIFLMNSKIFFGH